MNSIWLNAVRASQAAAGNWWDGLTDVVAVYQPIGAASLAASYVNLVNPGTFDAAPGVAPTHSAATGWGFNGVDQYLTTGIVPASGWSLIVRFSNAAPDETNRMLLGQNSALLANRRFFIMQVTAGGVRYGAGNFVDVLPVLTSGVLAVAGQQGYRNGVADGGAIGAWGGATANSIYIGCLNFDGLAVAFFANNTQAIAICSSTQTAAQIAAVSAAMAAL